VWTVFLQVVNWRYSSDSLLICRKKFEEVMGKNLGWKFAVGLYVEQILLAIFRGVQKIYTPVL